MGHGSHGNHRKRGIPVGHAREQPVSTVIGKSGSVVLLSPGWRPSEFQAGGRVFFLPCDPSSGAWAALGARPSISPDGTIIAFAAKQPDQPIGVYLCYQSEAGGGWSVATIAGGGRPDDLGYTAANGPLAASFDPWPSSAHLRRRRPRQGSHRGLAGSTDASSAGTRRSMILASGPSNDAIPGLGRLAKPLVPTNVPTKLAILASWAAAAGRAFGGMLELGCEFLVGDYRGFGPVPGARVEVGLGVGRFAEGGRPRTRARAPIRDRASARHR